MTIMRGDSYPIFLNLRIDGLLLKPDMIVDLELYIGNNFRKTYLEDGIQYDETRRQWYFWPTQEETFMLDIGKQDVTVRARYPNDPVEVCGYKIDYITVRDSHSREVL